MKRRFFSVSILVCVLAGPAAAGEEVIAVIVNKDVQAQRLNRDELRSLFQVTRKEWPNGKGATPLNLPESNSLRKGFDSAVLGLDPDRVERYWIDRKIRGDGRPPKKVPTTALMLRSVAKTEGAIGYLEASEVDGSVRVVARIKNGNVVAP